MIDIINITESVIQELRFASQQPQPWLRCETLYLLRVHNRFFIRALIKLISRTCKIISMCSTQNRLCEFWADLLAYCTISVPAYYKHKLIKYFLLCRQLNVYTFTLDLRSSIFLVVTQRILVFIYRSFGTTYRSHFQESSSKRTVVVLDP